MRLRIMTYNIHSGRDAFGTLDLQRIENTIRSLNPDICALNEVRMRTEDVGACEQARALGERLGMRWAFAPAMPYHGGEYGIGMLSRLPIQKTEFFPVPEVPAERREKRYEPRVLLRCEILAERPIAVYTSHYGLSDEEQQNAVELTLRHVREESLPVAFMGDLNMTPDHPLIQSLSCALSDSAKEKHFPTFHALDPKIKIDYVFFSPEFRVLNTDAPFSAASDHFPLVTDVEIA